eukprot:5808046-Pyramimonas_sp.AAC.1
MTDREATWAGGRHLNPPTVRTRFAVTTPLQQASPQGRYNAVVTEPQLPFCFHDLASDILDPPSPLPPGALDGHPKSAEDCKVLLF